MGPQRRGGGKSSAASKQSRSASPGRVNKHAKSTGKSTTVANTGLLIPEIRPLRSPIMTRGVVKSGLQQQQQSGQAASSSTSSSAPVPTSNEFEVLDENNSDVDLLSDPGTLEEQHKKSAPRKLRLPPIHVVDTLYSTVDDLLIENDISFTLTVTKSSVRVTLTERSEFDKTISVLKNKNIKYFTYDISDNVPVKIVLQGFPLVAIPSLLRKLKRAGVQPMDVKLLSKTTTVTGDHALYVLCFERGTVKINDLRRIKFLDGFGVTWRYFTKRPTDAAQCHRCQKFGHGSRNCNLPPSCVKCGESHLTDGCSLPRKADLGEHNAQQLKASVKCANCGGNHTANFRGCSARKTYIQALEKKKKVVSSSPPTAPRSTKSHVLASHNSPTNPPGWGRTYASVAASGNGVPVPDTAAEGGLFTLSEFLSLARDMYNRLNVCKTKQQQFFALSELMGKYLYDVQG